MSAISPHTTPKTHSPHPKIYCVKRSTIEQVFRRHGWINPDNGTWTNGIISLHIPSGDRFKKEFGQKLMNQARENGRYSTLHHHHCSPKRTYQKHPLKERNR